MNKALYNQFIVLLTSRLLQTNRENPRIKDEREIIIEVRGALNGERE
jgi:hypothetical protein